MLRRSLQALALALAPALPAGAQNGGAVSDSLRLYYIGYAVGWETYSLKPTASGFQLDADLDYVDRGRRNHVQGTMQLAANYAPRQLEIVRLTDTSRTIATRIALDGSKASVLTGGKTTDVALPAVAFAISPYQPVAQHLALLRYWMAHGSPPSMAIIPGGPTNPVRITRQGIDTVRRSSLPHSPPSQSPPSLPESPPSLPESPPSLPESPPSLPESPPSLPESPPSLPESPPSLPESPPSLPESPPSPPRTRGPTSPAVDSNPLLLTRYAIDGVVWGTEYVWLDRDGHLALFTTGGGGGLSFEAVRKDLDPLYPELMEIAARAAMKDLAAISRTVKPIAQGRVALVGATLVDGTGSAAIPNATVVVADGRIVAAGPSASTPVPPGTRRIDVNGKTIIPGLWDMHTHLNQLEWAPVYLAAGITTVRDMGNEIPFVTAMRRDVNAGRALGPRILLAGLIDGGGPNAFGALNATTPDEGRAIVRRYHQLGFEQMKLYSLLKPDVVAAICREAHALGMTVTGHVPTALSLLAAVDSGMDQIAHQPVRGDPQSDSVKRVIAELKRHGTVIDPTASWGELLGHSTAEPVTNLQPVVHHLPQVLALRISAMGTANIDTATAHERMRRTLGIIKALYDAGVPVVAGTDEGIPGFSVYREVELYAKAGMPPVDALRAAATVPARAMRIDRDVGTLETGKWADLLVLDANPLDDISNVRRVRLVMKGGTLWDSAEIWRAIGFKP